LTARKAVLRPQRCAGPRTCPTVDGNSVNDVGDDEGERREAWEADGQEPREISSTAAHLHGQLIDNNSRAVFPAATTIPYFYQV